MIVLHGGGGNADHAIRMTGMSPKADKEGFLVVYPNGTGTLGDRVLTWNSGNCCGYALDNQVDDVGFIRALIEQVERDVRVDGRHIFAAGISNGGMMVYRLACGLADRIAAIAPVAGALNVDCRPAAPVSVIAFHGTADAHVLYNGGPPITKLDPHDRVDQSVAYSVGFWVAYNGCSPAPQREERGNVVREAYSGGTDGTDGMEVVLYTIQGGRHAWPGGQIGGALGDELTQEISATDLMWEFFARHPKL